MTATIKAKSGRYYVMIDYTQNQKRVQRWIKTEYKVGEHCARKLEQRRLSLLREYQDKIQLVDIDILFSDYLVWWLEEIKRSLALSTYHSYYQAINHCIAPYFSERKIKLSELKGKDLQAFYNFKQDVDNVSANTIKHYHSYIHRALAYAVKTERLNRNPADNVQLPKIEKHLANYYSAYELNKLLDYARGKPIEIIVRLAAWFGLRRGEIIGLRWSYIDFDRAVLTVAGVVKDKGNPNKSRELYYEPTAKTAASLRSFPMPPSAVDYLRSIKQAQDERRARYKGYNHTWDDFVCVRDKGDIIPLEYVSRAFPKLCEQAGLRRLRLHELRHTNISLLLEQGASMRELQEWAGHSTYKLTADTYSHVQVKSKLKLADMLDNIIISK